MAICKECKWYQPSPVFDPSIGECKPPTQEEASNPGFGGMRHEAKTVNSRDEACERFEMGARGGKFHDVI